MARRCYLLQIALSICALGWLMPLGGCVPGAIVEWTIAPLQKNSLNSSEQDFERARHLIVKLGYINSGSGTGSLVGAEFYILGASQRFGLELLRSGSGATRVKLIEHNERQLTTLGRQQVARIADALESEFGRDRISFAE